MTDYRHSFLPPADAYGGADRFAPVRSSRLYQRIDNPDPERTAGSQFRYASFNDFLVTFEEEARDPTRVGAADVLDVINPLQHLPLVSNVYRELTGDQIKPGARMIGGAVFGGGMGLASSSVNAVIEEETGRDLAGNMALALSGKDSFVAQAHAVFPDPDGGTLAMGFSSDPERTGEGKESVAIEWRSERRADSAHVASAYRRVARMEPEVGSGVRSYEIVEMTDPERTAGTMVRYA